MNIDITFDRRLFNDVYVPTYKCQDRYLFLYGGAGSGKSEWAAQKVLIRMLKETPHRFLLARKVAATIRNSQILLLKDIIARWGVEHLFKFTDLSVKCANGNEIISTGMDNPEKLKSITSISGIWAEELTEFHREDMLQLNLRMRGHRRHYKQFIGSFNPTDIEHWIRKTYFPEGDTENNFHRFEIPDRGNEYNKLYGTALRTTYRDNKFIDDTDRASLTALEEMDENYHRIYAQGLWGVRSKGLIYTKYSIVESMPEGLDYQCYGLDFGFVHPTALVHIGVKEAKVYVRQVIYLSNLTNPELIAAMKTLIPNRRVEIFADSANADKIEEIYRAGFNIHPANKNVEHGIGIVQNVPLHVTAESSDVLREIRRYTTKLDKYGNPLNEVVKLWDDAMDAMRYGIYTAWTKYGERVFSGKPKLRTANKPKRERTRRDDFESF